MVWELLLLLSRETVSSLSALHIHGPALALNKADICWMLCFGNLRSTSTAGSVSSFQNSASYSGWTAKVRLAAPIVTPRIRILRSSAQ
jgi:hypothetical protein